MWRRRLSRRRARRRRRSSSPRGRRFSVERQCHGTLVRSSGPERRPDDMPFTSFGLHADLLRGVKELGFIRPTPIQNDAIPPADRKSTRLNSSHQIISYAVFCLKKKNNNTLLIPSS